jgi:hypothetical protein
VLWLSCYSVSKLILFWCFKYVKLYFAAAFVKQSHSRGTIGLLGGRAGLRPRGGLDL